MHMLSLKILLFTSQYLERELRMEGLPFTYSFEVRFSWKHHLFLITLKLSCAAKCNICLSLIWLEQFMKYSYSVVLKKLFIDICFGY